MCQCENCQKPEYKDLQRVDEMTTPPEVGKTYLVWSVWTRHRLNGTGATLPGFWHPVVGGPHSDQREYGFGGPTHIHYDQRFLTEEVYQDQCLPTNQTKSPFHWAILLAWLLDHENWNGKLVHAPMPCLREMPMYYADDCNFATHTLEAKLAGQSAAACLRCPHRGTPLASTPIHSYIDKEGRGRGVVICPSHGLAFDARTGEMIPRAECPIGLTKPADAFGKPAYRHHLADGTISYTATKYPEPALSGTA